MKRRFLTKYSHVITTRSKCPALPKNFLFLYSQNRKWRSFKSGLLFLIQYPGNFSFWATRTAARRGWDTTLLKKVRVPFFSLESRNFQSISRLMVFILVASALQEAHTSTSLKQTRACVIIFPVSLRCVSSLLKCNTSKHRTHFVNTVWWTNRLDVYSELTYVIDANACLCSITFLLAWNV